MTFLEQVVVALTEKKTKNKDHVPYRQSKLTHILKDSIGGNCKTVMVATIWPEPAYLQETLSTLNFAKRMKNVVNEMTVNIQLDTAAMLRKMTKEIKELKQELAMHNTLANRGRINYDPYTPEEQQTQQNIAKKYLTGENEDIEFDSVRQAKELFYQIRYIYQKIKTIGAKKYANQIQAQQQQEKKEEKKEEKKDEKKDDKKEKKKEEKKEEKTEEKFEEKKEGEISPIQEEKKEGEEEIKEENKEKEEQKLLLQKVYEKYPTGRIPDKNSAFLIYKNESSYSQEIETQMKKNTEQLKTKKTEARV